MGHTWSPGESQTSQRTQAASEPIDIFLKAVLYNNQLLISLIKSHWACTKQGGPQLAGCICVVCSVGALQRWWGAQSQFPSPLHKVSIQ